MSKIKDTFDPSVNTSLANNFWRGNTGAKLANYQKSTIGQAHQKAGQDMSNLLFKNPFEFGKQMKLDVSDLANSRNPRHQFQQTNALRNLGKQAGRTLSTGSLIAGAGNPLGVAGYAALGGGLNYGANRTFGKQGVKEARTGAIASTIEALPKSFQMAGISKFTNPAIDKASKVIGAGGFIGRNLIKAPLNVLEGVVMDRATGYETTPMSVAVDAIFPVVGDLGGTAFRSSSDAVKAAEFKIKQKIGHGARNKGGMYTTMEKFIKGTRPYRKGGKNSLGALAGIEPYQNEDGKWEVRINNEKALMGIAIMAGGIKALDKADDVLKQADDIAKGVDDSLIKEARKFKSADEFVKSQTFEEKALEKSFSNKDYPMANRGEWYGEANYKEEGGVLIEMTPDEFLDRAAPLKIDEVSRDNIDDLKNTITSGRTLDPLTLYTPNKTDVRGTDGRHRAIAAKELGIKKVPVVSFFHKPQLEDIYNKAKITPAESAAMKKFDVRKLGGDYYKVSPTGAVSATMDPQSTAEISRIVREEKLYDKGIAKALKDSKAKVSVDDLVKKIKDNTNKGYLDIESMKDIKNLEAGSKDIYRNTEKVFGDAYPRIKADILDPFDNAKGKFIDMQTGLLEELDTNIIKGLGIKKGSKLSRQVQEYGEGLIDLTSVAKADQAKVVQADKFFRSKYDEVLDTTNASIAKIFPNQPNKLIPKRTDYYRHFKEMEEGLGGIKNIFENSANIDPKLAGISDFTKPRAKWLSMAQQRLGIETEYDAVGGFLNYIRQASYATHIDPQISKFRNLRTDLVDATTQGADPVNVGKLNNYIEFLNDYANDLAGKTNPMDRTIQKYIPGGRKAFRMTNWLNRRVKANVILGNLSSSLAQVGNVPQAIADMGSKHFAKGTGGELAALLGKETPITKSNFIKERYFDDYAKFDTGVMSSVKKMAVWVVQVLDEVSTKATWHGYYDKAITEKMKFPVKYADGQTRKMVAGRGIGEVPLIQKSKMFQLVAPFQLEVANLWHVFGDWTTKGEWGKFVKYAVAAHFMNRIIKNIRGSDVTFDPIQATIDGVGAYAEEDDKTIGMMKFMGRMSGEVISNKPLGQTAAALYPEYGFTMGDTQMPTREEFFGEGDPTRYGSGILVAKGLQDPGYKIAPAYGGQQIKRTLQGLKDVSQGEISTRGGKMVTPIAQTPANYVKSAAFGARSTPEAQKASDNKPLSEKQSEQVRQSKNPQATYNLVIGQREYRSEIRNIKEKVKKTGKEQTVMGKLYYPVDEVNEDTGKIETTVKTLKVTDPTPSEIYANLGKKFSKSEDAPANIFKKIVVYGTGIFKDPTGTMNAIKTGQPIRKLRGDAVVVERLSSLASMDLGDKETQVDHIVALALGGDNSETNLQIISVQDNQAKGVVDTYLAGLLESGKINKAEAQERDLNWRNEVNTLPSNLKDKATNILAQEPKPLPTKPQLYTIGGSYVITNKNTGKKTLINLDDVPEYPKLTGQSELDKKLLSSYNGKITTRVNNITKIYLDEQITAEQANNAIVSLRAVQKALKKATAKPKKGKKPKKITLKKPPALKRHKVSTKPIALPKLEQLRLSNLAKQEGLRQPIVSEAELRRLRNPILPR